MRDIKFRCYVKFLGEMHEVKEMILDNDAVMIVMMKQLKEVRRGCLE